MTATTESGTKVLDRLRKTDPPVWLAPNQELSQAARAASRYLFSSLKRHSPKSPFDELLSDGFDVEQIWQQIDLQSQPLLSSLRREVKKFEKNPEEISKSLHLVDEKESNPLGGDEDDSEDMEMDTDRLYDEDDDGDDDGEEEEDIEGEQKEELENEGDEETEEEEEGGGGGIEDKFLKIKELQEYLEEGEAEELGLNNKKRKKDTEKGKAKESSSDEDVEDLEGDEDEDDEVGALADEDYEDGNDLENARYEDFFGDKKKASKRKSGDWSEEDNEGKANLSTHEKELKNIQSKIEEMEKANLGPKEWTMQGEVTAAKRPKNSALEADLDFDHNVRPAPVITEEVTASIEDMIKNRIIEGNFNDVQRPPTLPTKAPRELKELDDNKSKKGLAEVYEEEYVQNTNPALAPTSFSEELKKEANVLFKRLCLKLDALSHFHFTPKPVIEDMSIQANVPALAMEEIAPLAVSDAAMLAPEEIFAGKGDIKEETELTKAERKRRRANKKGRFKAESAKRMAKKAQMNMMLNQNNDEEQR